MQYLKFIIISSIALIFLNLSPGHAFEKEKEKEITFKYLMSATESQLAELDIALVNLLCGQGLPGSENLDIEASIKTLDHWAKMIRRETEIYANQFYNNPQKYNNSLAYYNILMMVTVLQKDLGAVYNMRLVESGIMYDMNSTLFYRDSNDLFLHGFFSFGHGGSCTSLPVLVVAIGRRLGYPLKLVTTKGHLFARWDDGKHNFNIDVAGRGLNTFPDSHYKKFPFSVSEADIEREGLLKSLSPIEELSVFLETRGMCLLENKRYKEATSAFMKAFEIKPKSKYIPFMIHKIQQESLTQNKRLK